MRHAPLLQVARHGEYFVPAGTFDTNDFDVTSQIYVDKKPCYYSFSNVTRMLTEQQVIAQYGPPDGKPA
jgi:hypothetical protein